MPCYISAVNPYVTHLRAGPAAAIMC
jgi:hypothetical protein